MIWPFRKSSGNLDRAEITLETFASLALDGLERQTLREQSRTRQLAECYVYGAVQYLASYDDMDAADTGALMLRIFASHFDDATGGEVNRCRGSVSGGTEQLFMIEGASALRRWLISGDPKIAGDLNGLLEKLN